MEVSRPTARAIRIPQTICSWLTLKKKVYLYFSEVLQNLAIDLLPPMLEIWVNRNGDIIHTQNANLVDTSNIPLQLVRRNSAKGYSTQSYRTAIIGSDFMKMVPWGHIVRDARLVSGRLWTFIYT